MPRVDVRSRPGLELEKAASQLEKTLRALLEGQKRLLRKMERKREAIRRADIGAITELCTEENALAQRIGDLEKHRLRVVGAITEILEPDAAAPLNLASIAEGLNEEAGTRLLAIGAELKEAVRTVRRESSVLRSAAEALAGHMAGIAQTVHAAINRAGVYGRAGTVALGAQTEFAIDLKS